MTDDKKILTLPKKNVEATTVSGVIDEAAAEKLAASASLDALIPDLAPPVAAAPAEPLISDATKTLEGLLSLLPVGLGVAGLKNTAAVWTAESCKIIAERTIPVLKKYVLGQKIINFLETGSGIEEVALATALVPIGLASYRGYQLDLAASEAVKNAENPVTDKTTEEPIKFTADEGFR